MYARPSVAQMREPPDRRRIEACQISLSEAGVYRTVARCMCLRTHVGREIREIVVAVVGFCCAAALSDQTRRSLSASHVLRISRSATITIR